MKMRTEPQPCKGGCGRMLRPKRADKSMYPGTVRTEARGRCQICNASLVDPTINAEKPRTGKCMGCHRPTRRRGTRLEDYPGTVGEYNADHCMTCWRHQAYGPPHSKKPEYNPWADCADCERPMRPHNLTRADAPGTVKHHARGLCTTCHRRAQNPDMLDRPLIVGRTPTRPTRHQEPEPAEEKEITDPALLRLLNSRQERQARQDQQHRLRVAQEAARARFIQSRRAA